MNKDTRKALQILGLFLVIICAVFIVIDIYYENWSYHAGYKDGVNDTATQIYKKVNEYGYVNVWLNETEYVKLEKYHICYNDGFLIRNPNFQRYINYNLSSTFVNGNITYMEKSK